MKLKEMKFTDFELDQKYNFVLPIWATEQHWDFIPYWTDTYITDYIVRWIENHYKNFIIIPTLEYSRSQEHRWFYGSIWLNEDTLKSVMHDICNSLKDRAKNIFIISAHANEAVIDSFIQTNSFLWVNVSQIYIYNDEDDKIIEEIIQWPIDDHAWNTEISSILYIDKSLVKLPTQSDTKKVVKNAFSTDNLIEFSKNWIVDNHPEWIVSKEHWKKILDVYLERVIKNINQKLTVA